MDATVVLYLKCVLAIIGGVIGHTYSKFITAQELWQKGNVGELGFMDFIKKKPSSHIFNLVLSMFWLIFVPDAVKAVPKISIEYIGIKDNVYLANIFHIMLCACLSFGGSSFLLKVLGVGNSYAMKVIDEKTNKADGK